MWANVVGLIMLSLGLLLAVAGAAAIRPALGVLVAGAYLGGVGLVLAVSEPRR